MLISPDVAYCPGQHGMRPLRAAETSIAADVLALAELAEQISPGVIRTPRMPVIAPRPAVYPHPRSPYARDRAAWAMEQARGFLASAIRDRHAAECATTQGIRRAHRANAAWSLAQAAAATRDAARELRCGDAA